MLTLALAPAALAAKFYDSTVGTTSALAGGVPPTPAGTAFGGAFGAANEGVGDVAVNDPSITTDGTGQSGWVYVVDRGSNRVQAFNSAGAFQWAIGRDVIASTVNEAQLLTVTATGGSFQLCFNAVCTGDLAWNAPASSGAGNVQTALRDLTSIDDTAVLVTGAPANGTTVPVGRYAIQFTTTMAAADQGQITVQPGTSPLVGGTATTTTLANGSAATPGNLGDVFEKCAVAGNCKAGSIGTAGDGPGGEFNLAMGIDIDQATGHLFVLERTPNRRVQEFTADGQFVRAFGWDITASGPGNTGGFETCNAAAGDVCQASTAAGNATGQFGSATQNIKGLAVGPLGAPNAGKVYVADPGNGRIQRFAIPPPTAPTDPVVVGAPFGATPVVGTPTEDDRFASTTGLTWPRDVAADANGVVYGSSVIGSANPMVKRFDTTAGVFLPQIGDGSATSFLGSGNVPALEVDPVTDHLLVGRSADLGVMEFDLTGKPEVVDGSHLVDSHIAGMGATLLALGAGGGRYFASTSSTISGTGAGQRVLVLDADGVDPDPVVTIAPAANVTATTATFNGRVDPILTSGFPTFYRWQISKDGVTWTDATSSVVVPPNGFTASDVTHNATGLEPNTLYRLRIRTDRNPSAGFAYSSVLLFQTNPAPPKVETRPVQHVSDVSAQLVGNLNPGGLSTTHWFEWGDDNYGNQIPVPAATANGGLDRQIAETLTGLTPERVYHYRLCAKNSFSPVKVCGTDRTFTTRATATSPTVDRTYEMVTSPDKAQRRGGERGRGGYDYTRLEAGMPARDGGAFRTHLWAGPVDPDAGNDAVTQTFNHEIRNRQPGGRWTGNAVFNLSPLTAGDYATAEIKAESANLDVSMWNMNNPIFATGTYASLRVMGDDGGPHGGGWYPWIDPAWWAGTSQNDLRNWNGSISDAANRMVLVSGDPSGAGTQGRDITPVDDTRSPGELVPPQAAGRAVFLSDANHDWRPTDLVSECTGTGGNATVIPLREDGGTRSGPSGSVAVTSVNFAAGGTTVTIGFGSLPAGIRAGHFVTGNANIAAGTRVVSVDSATQFTIDTPALGAGSFASMTVGQNTAALADDTLGVRSCEAGSPTDVRGGIFGSIERGRLGETSAAAMSESGDRVFFLSPDPLVATGQTACEAGDGDVAAGTRCPTQLFVRQFDDSGNPTVRWISRPEDSLFFDGLGDPQMNPAALGTGVAFEGASRDGRYVYFRTDAPLTEDDPNGGLDPLEAASQNSWDLYRYDLGPDNNTDPAAGDPGDHLVRISAGPNPSGAPADPNTNCTAKATNGPQTGNCWAIPDSANTGTANQPNGAGGALRFVSDDGERAYFVTAASIPTADNSPRPEDNTANIPTSTSAQINDTSRNLYAYDATAPGGPTYRFVARVPMTGLDRCATFNTRALGAPHTTNMRGFGPGDARAEIYGGLVNCVHGSGSGDAVLFETTAQLTNDDIDGAADVYLYDAEADELVRLSAPSPGGSPYPCVRPDQRKPADASCNGDLGFGLGSAYDYGSQGEGSQFGWRQWNVAQDAQGNLLSVFFQSRVPLVSEDQNSLDAEGLNGGMDVYRWTRADGRLSLITPGEAGDDSSFYAGNSVDGKDVFFWTEQRISPWEIDDADGDVYNATIRTDLRAAPPAPPVVCTALTGACQGGGSGSVAVDSKTSSSDSSDGNGVSPDRTRLTISALSAQARKGAARSGRLALSVRTSSAGKLSVVVRAKVGKRASRVGAASKLATKSGAVKVDVRLSSAARKRLRSGRSLRVTVEVRQPGARARAMSVLLPGVKS